MFIEAHENIATMLERKHSRFKASTPMKVLLVEDSILIRNMLIEIVNRASN